MPCSRCWHSRYLRARRFRDKRVDQYKLYPRLFTKSKSVQIYLDSRGKFRTFIESDYNKVVAKVFGDAAAKGGQLGIDGLFARNSQPREKTKSHDEFSAAALIAENATGVELYTSLKTRLENALLTEKQETIKTISNLALDVRRSPEFGKNLLKKLYQQKPQLKKMKDPEIQQAANALIETIVDEDRAKWAQDWFYYGHDPATTSTQEMSQKLEREIWGLWILDMGFGMVEYDNTSFAGEVVSGGVYYMVEAANGIPFDELIVERLIELGVVFPQTQRQLAELNSRNFGNPNKQNPNVFIEKKVDEEKEITAINEWAKKHPIESLSGNVDSTVRKLPKIIDVHK